VSEEDGKAQEATAGQAASASPTKMTPGKPTDALTAVEGALVRAAKSTPPNAANPRASDAFALGWQMAELYRPQSRRRAEAADDDLPGLGSLGDRDRMEILVDQVQVQATRLGEPIHQAGLPPIDIGPLRTSLDEGEPAHTDAVRALHRQLLGSLTAVDFRLGKAYGLGRALADTCRKPADLDELRDELDTYRIANLLGWLDDLSTALPPHAAHSVGTSLNEWVEWAAPNEPDPTSRNAVEMLQRWRRPRLAECRPEDAVTMLRRQGEIWRALLSGEKQGTEMLELDNYLDAARHLAETARSILKGVMCRFPALVLLAAILLFGGIGLLASGGGSKIVAGATGLLVALGLSWRGLGAVAGQLAGKLEQPLYDSLLDRAIADAITLCNDKGEYRERRALALQMSPSADGARRPQT